MSAESQDIEWKTSWHDKYLKWICGFANAQGGTLYIGKDDNGTVKHLDDAKLDFSHYDKIKQRYESIKA